MPTLGADDLVALALPGGPAAEDAVVDALRGLDEDERRPLARGVARAARELDREGRWQPAAALALALLGTGSLTEVKRRGRAGIRFVDGVRAAAVLDDRRPAWLGDWAAWIVDEWPAAFLLVRRLVRAGVIAAPDTDGYVLGLVALPRTLIFEDVGVTLREFLLDDRELLAREVWRMFEVEGGGEVSLAMMDGFREGWTETLLALARDGQLPRDRLLDASLEALGRDFSSFRAGWFSRFHEALRPAAAERAARADAYVRLLSSPISNTVSFALKALTQLAKAGDLRRRADLVERLRPALASERRTIVVPALALLPPGDEAAVAACAALGHRDAAVQAKALDVIERTPTPRVRAALLAHADDVAPTLRERVADAVGVAAPAVDAPGGGDLGALRARATALSAAARELAAVDAALDAAAAGVVPDRLRFAVADLPVLACAEPIAPLDDIDELIEILARWIETGPAVDAQVERALGALARMGPARPDDLERRASSLRRRALALDEGPRRAIVEAWLDGTAPGTGRPGGRARLREIAEQVAARRAQPLLATPTHAGGWIDPAVLVARLADVPSPGRHDLIAALCRLAPDGRDPAAVPDGPVADIVRYALGGPEPKRTDPALLCAARLGRELDRVEPPGRYEAHRGPWSTRLRIDLGPIDLELASVVPALRVGIEAHPPWREPGLRPSAEVSTVQRLWLSFNSDAAVEEALLFRPAGHQLLWAERHSRVLALALDPDRPLDDIGALTLAIVLASEDVGERAVGLDVAIAAIADGRLDGPSLGAPARTLVEAGLALPTRLAPALRTVAAESPLHAEVVRVALEHAVAITPAPRGMHALLDALNELAADAGAAVELPQARAALETIGGSGKAAKLARELLRREGTSTLTPTAATLAAEARIDRAERWTAATRSASGGGGRASAVPARRSKAAPPDHKRP